MEPELVDKFQDALKRTPSGSSRLHRPELSCGMTMPLPAGLKLPRFVPTYEAVDALFEPILEDARELQEYAATRVVELEAELAKVNFELVRMQPCCRMPDTRAHCQDMSARRRRRSWARARTRCARGSPWRRRWSSTPRYLPRSTRRSWTGSGPRQMAMMRQSYDKQVADKAAGCLIALVHSERSSACGAAYVAASGLVCKQQRGRTGHGPGQANRGPVQAC